MNNILDFVLKDPEIQSYVQDRRFAYLQSELGYDSEVQDIVRDTKILRIEFLLLNKLLSTSLLGDTDKQLFEISYSVLKSFNINDLEFLSLFKDIFGINGVDPHSLYYFYLAALALKSDRTIQARLDLKAFEFKENINWNWQELVINKVLAAFILLVRKDNGYKDIRRSLELISELKSSQSNFERAYLESSDGITDELVNAQKLLGWYHLSKTITETADYLIAGYNYAGRLESEIRIHSDVAKKLFVSFPKIQSLINILEDSLFRIQFNSIWYSTNAIQIKKLKDFCVARSLTDKGIIDLLPSQRDALRDNMLDIAASVTVIEMPTSSGKTLLAEFNIIVTKALNQDSKIVYVVPSRALVNQVYFDLKLDFTGLDFVIEKTSSAIEIDPTENLLLLEHIDILVSTPEKLDLLIRRKHPSVEDVALFVIDEAHMIQNNSRGTKLELLLAILKRERPNSKFMLLSPFLKGSADIIANWLGGNKSTVPIKINWTPAEKLLLGIKQKKNFKKFTQTLLPSAYSSVKIEQPVGEIDLDYDLEGSEKQKYLHFTAKRYGIKGKSVLYLCRGPGTVDNLALFLYNTLPDIPHNPLIDLVRKFIIDEVGKETVLTKVLSRGIALHHAGLSDETKLLVEYLIREKHIQHIFATSTLAEGVNFPVSTVYFDTYLKGPDELTSSDFWNIAGRAGRTLVENYGKLIFPFNNKENTDKAKALINKSSQDIASVLLELVINSESIIKALEKPDDSPLFKLANQYSKSLEPLIQYLIHLLSSSGSESSLEVEDLFKDSLGYFQASPSEKIKFIQICKLVYFRLQKRYQPGVLGFADKTGFSVPSVLAIMATENKQNPSISSPESWEINNLFDRKNDYLVEKIKVIAKLKETKLGTDSSSAPFNEQAVADVLIGWVKGEQLFNIAEYHPTFANTKDEADRINEFIRYMNSARFKASWGLGALEGIINASGDQLQDNSHISSLIYYGVDTKEALLMRMAGVPRRLAKSLGAVLNTENLNLSQLRNTINSLSAEEWNKLAPEYSNLTGVEWKQLSEILVK